MYKEILTQRFLYTQYVVNGKTLTEIANDIGCSSVTINNYLKKFHISRRLRGPQKGKPSKYPINQIYFHKWSSDMAYVLGLLITDGCLSFTSCPSLRFTFKTEDKELLEFIQAQISPTRPIRFLKHFNATTNKYYNECAFSITGLSESLINRLLYLKIIPNKTGKEKLPKCPQKYKGDLLRGIFDGDGSVYRDSRYTNRWVYAINSASQLLLKQIQHLLCHDYGNIYTNKKRQHFYYIIYKQQHIKNIVKLMYESQNFALSRKKQRFIDGGFLD